MLLRLLLVVAVLGGLSSSACLLDDGGPDAGALDAGLDAGVLDAGLDAGALDAGLDAGDAGRDAGTPSNATCPELRLWTYSKACEVDADCILVGEDPSYCDCPTYPIAASEWGRYEQAVEVCAGEDGGYSCSCACCSVAACFDGVCGSAEACDSDWQECSPGYVCNGTYCEEAPSSDAGPNAGNDAGSDAGPSDAGELDAGDAGQ
jgi:hypothetical protein